MLLSLLLFNIEFSEMLKSSEDLSDQKRIYVLALELRKYKEIAGRRRRRQQLENGKWKTEKWEISKMDKDLTLKDRKSVV